MSGQETIASVFRPLLGQLCWNVENGFSSWLTLHWGSPRIHVMEPQPDTDSVVFQNRIVNVEGEYRLWVEMARWVVFQDGAKIANDESDQPLRQRAAQMLKGQRLLGLDVDLGAPMAEFTFDFGGRLSVARYQDWEPGHELWHLYGPERVTSLRADGAVTQEVVSLT